MSEIVAYDEVEKRILNIRGQKVLLDRDVAELYGTETREINKAVKNNPAKFPDGYIFTVDKIEKDELVENFHRFNTLKHSSVMPTAFTEKGLYMLATILKSPPAIQTTIAIVETFTKLRALSQTMNQLAVVDNAEQQKSLLQKGSKMLSDFLLNNIMEIDEDETSMELDLAILKVKRTVKRKKRKNPKV